MKLSDTSRRRPRTCVGCRQESPKRALIRIVRSPEGKIVLDDRGKIPGRGAYLCASLDCLAKAQKTKALSRALKVEVSEEVYASIEEYLSVYAQSRSEDELKKELCALLGLSRRAGLIYIGTDSVKSQCTNELLLILSARDSSEAVSQLMSGLAENARHEYYCLPLNAEELSHSLGGTRIQAIALPLQSGLAEKIKILLQEGGVALEQNESLRACQDTRQNE